MLRSVASVGVQPAPDDRLRELLYRRFRGAATPVLAGDGFAVPAASLWAGARLWVAAFRQLGLGPGDRVAIDLPVSPGAAMVAIAVWWIGGVVLLSGPRSGASGRVAIRVSDRPGPRTIVPAASGAPGAASGARRPVARAPSGTAAEFGEREPPLSRDALADLAGAPVETETTLPDRCDDRAAFVSLWSSLLAGGVVGVRPAPTTLDGGRRGVALAS